MQKLVSGIIFLIISTPAISALPAEEILAKANQAYLAGEFSHAVELYEEIRAKNLESASLHLNLGNAYFREGRFGLAILNYERALRLNPRHENANFNLGVAQSRIVDQVSPVPTIFYVSWWQGFYSIFTIDNWGWMVIFCLILTLFCLGFYFFSKTRRFKILAFVATMGFLLLMAVSNLAARAQYYNSQQKKEAIVMLPRVAAKSSPSVVGAELFVIHEGSKATITNELNDWFEIRLANGNVGWVPRASLEVI